MHPPTAFTPEPVRRRLAGMKTTLLILMAVALVGCGESKEEKLSEETLKNPQQLQKLNAEMKIKELERENENLRAKVASLQIQIATLPHPVIVHAEEGAHAEESGGNRKTATKRETPVPIVKEGEFIVVNPAGSTRYLLVEILLIRKNAFDNEFPYAVKDNRKRLEEQVSKVLSAMTAEEMAKPSTRNGMPNQLKKLFQTILGSSHPIDKVIIPKWVMQ